MNLYVNNTKIELAPGEQITLSKAVGRVGEIGTRSGVISADFDVLATSVNLDTLGYNDQLESENTVLPRNKQSAYIEDEGHEITRGFIQIVSTDKVGKRITLAFFGENVDWFNRMAGKFINEPDYTDLDHDWTEANITASFTNTSGYIYPGLDYGRIIDSTIGSDWDTEIEDWYPAIYRHTIIDRIFRGIGYTVTGEFLDTFEYKNAILPFSLSLLEKDTSQLLATATDGLAEYTFDDPLVAGTSATDTQVINISIVEFDPQSAFNLTTDRFVATETLNDATFLFQFAGDLAITTTAGVGATAEIKFIIRKNGSAEVTETLLTQSGTGTATDSDVWEFSYTDDLVATDYIDAVFEFSYSGASVGVTSFVFQADTDYFNFKLDSVNGALIAGATISMGKTLPDISQIDLVKDMIMQNNLIVSGDPAKGTVEFTRFDKLYENMPSAVDWSERVDLGDMNTVDFVESTFNFARVSRFKYQEPNEDDTHLTTYNESNDTNYGEGILNVDNDFIDPDKVVYESPFGATFMLDSVTTAVNTVKLGYIPYFANVGTIPLMTAGELESKPRIMYVIPNASVRDIATKGPISIVTIEVTTYQNVAYAYFANHRRNSDLDVYTGSMAYDTPNLIAALGDGLLTDNYANTLRILNKPRYIEISVRLWPHEFREIDFTIPVYIHAGNLQGYFYIDEIDDYVGNRVPATVKLIQLI